MSLHRIRVAFFTIISLVIAERAYSQNRTRNEYSARYSPNDYLLKSFNDREHSIFDENYQVIDLGANLTVSSDCGRVDFRNTLRSTLKNVLDSKYFGDLGKNIIASSPMLLTCYFSPTWCAILKHMQLNANFLSQMRLDQCALIDKYTDNRTEDYYRERQSCIRAEIDKNGGNLEQAMQSCRNYQQADLASWSGGDEKSATNKLIDSSVKWAGLTGPEAEKSSDLAKAFVADTVVAKGQMSVDYGPRRKALTPREHLKDLQNWFQDKLCDGIIKRISETNDPSKIDYIVKDQDLDELTHGMDVNLIDRQTIEAITYLPARQRQEACRKLSDTMALTVFTKDTNGTLDLLTVASQNPNLPPNRKEELDQKIRSLKDLVEITLKLQDERNKPLRDVLKEINENGNIHRDNAIESVLSSDEKAIRTKIIHSSLMDCSDGIMCNRR